MLSSATNGFSEGADERVDFGSALFALQGFRADHEIVASGVSGAALGAHLLEEET